MTELLIETYLNLDCYKKTIDFINESLSGNGKRKSYLK